MYYSNELQRRSEHKALLVRRDQVDLIHVLAGSGSGVASGAPPATRHIALF